MPLEIVLILLALLLLAMLFIAVPVVLIALWWRVSQLRRRLERLERSFQAAPYVQQPLATPPTAEIAPQTVAPASPVDAEIVGERPAATLPAFDWEMFLGRKALGWVAVVLVFFGTAFFLRYAFQNNWIGPLGRVAIGLTAGVALVLAGWRYFEKGWAIFSQMLTAAGFILLYLSTYSAFGFYQLLPQRMAAVFLMLIIAETALLAVRYNAPSLALMALIGGLLTPVLMHSEHDQYQALFTYLGVLNAGVLLLALWRHWIAIGSVALLGTHALFWMWYFENYHPEKLLWAIGFQVAVYGLFSSHTLAAHVFRPRPARWEDLGRMLLNAYLVFVAAYVLLQQDYRDWMGSLAVSMAALYLVLGKLMFAYRSDDRRQVLTALAIAVGFISLAIPIQADANWVALGWAAVAAALWWFGLRIDALALRAMSAPLAVLAVLRLMFVDTPWYTREPFWPLLNTYGLPALGVAACVLGSVVVTRQFAERIPEMERRLVAALGIGGILLLLMVLSVETYGYFDAQAVRPMADSTRGRWLGQMSVSALWALYASGVLAIGFWKQLAALRWTALGLFALTIAKVFLLDMAGLQEFYRILAFFIVAILLGAAAWAYQRIQPQLGPSETAKESTDGA